ncbi:MAG: efflux RND transporter periplasmic adaptor subunit [Prevotellaceae bacterium]|nr:efflux RND transporter periplasmic adaptor subunit [Prevotellaceae bacterium]
MKIGTFAVAVCFFTLLSSCTKKESKMDLQPIKVKTTEIKMSSVNGGQSYSGTIEEESGTSLSFSTAGTIKNILVNEGQTVRQGQLIATVDEASLKSAYDATLATLQQAEDAYARMKQLHDAGSLSEIKWIEVQTQLKQAVSAEKISRKGLSDTKLYAPFSGYISQKSAEAGQNVMPGVPVVKLVNISNVKVKISVPESEIANIKTGQSIQINVPALGGNMFTGKVTEKGISADAMSRSYEVKALIANPDRQLLPGMVCEAYTDMAKTDNQAILLPADIIQIDTDNKPFVWTVANGKAVKANVTVGENCGENVIITSGLTVGAKVITEGQQKVSSGMKVTE